MKTKILLILCWILSIGLGWAQKRNVKSVPSKVISTPRPRFTDSFSYALGLNYARYMLSQGIRVNPNDIAKGMHDILGEKPLAIDSSLVDYILQKRARQAMDSIIAGQKKIFATLLENNKRNPNIKEIMPGLQYEVLKDSTGVIPTDTSLVSVRYTGRLVDGKVFDQSPQEGPPIQFKVNQVIVGWQEALKKMPKGSAWRIYVASDLAYGDKGFSTIPGGSGLIFEIYLLDVK